MARRVDPLEARRKALIAEVVSVAIQLEMDTGARPWLVRAGCDPDAQASELRRLARVADAAVFDMELAKLERGVPGIDTARLIADVRLWQIEVRNRLRLANPEARRPITTLRAAMRSTARRLTGTIAMFRHVIPILHADGDALGPQVEAARLAARAEELLRDLEVNQAQHDEAADVQLARAPVARQAVDALRRELRAVRWAWRLAWDLSGRKIRRLDLGGLAADVWSRERRSQRGRTGGSDADGGGQDIDGDGLNTTDGGSDTDGDGLNADGAGHGADEGGSIANWGGSR